MADDRAANGQFLPGNAGGPGRPKRPPATPYDVALREVVTDYEWRSLILTTLEKAKKGDYRAREWLGKHLLAGGSSKVRSNDRDAEVEATGINRNEMQH